MNTHQKIEELFGKYWEIAFAEGVKGQSSGTNAQAVLNDLRRVLQDEVPLEPTSVMVPSEIDKGSWRYTTDATVTDSVHRHYLESDDFHHDVRLYVNGDFANADDRQAYGEAVAAALNSVSLQGVQGPATAARMKALFMEWWLTDMDNAELFNRTAPILGIVNEDLDNVPIGVSRHRVLTAKIVARMKRREWPEKELIEYFEAVVSENPMDYLKPNQIVYQVTQSELLVFANSLLRPEKKDAVVSDEKG